MGQPLTAANAHLAGATPPDPCAALKAEVELLRQQAQAYRTVRSLLIPAGNGGLLDALVAELAKAKATINGQALKVKAWDEEEAYRVKIGEYLTLQAKGLPRVAPSRRAYEEAAYAAREATWPGSAKGLADL